MNILSDTPEKFQGAYVSLTEVRDSYGPAADDAVRQGLAEIATGPAIAARVGDGKVDQFIRFFSMLNTRWHWRGEEAVAGWDRAFVAVYPRLSPEFNSDQRSGESEAENLERRGYTKQQIALGGDPLRLCGSSIAARFEIYFGVMFDDEAGVDRFGFSMMERELTRNVTYELGLIAKAFVVSAKKFPRVINTPKYMEIVAQALTKLGEGPDPFGEAPIHPSRKFFGWIRSFLEKELSAKRPFGATSL
jgi:hypothetical protein